MILIWPKDKNITYIDCSSTAHNFHEKLSCHLLQLETHTCTLNMWIMERLFVCLFGDFFSVWDAGDLVSISTCVSIGYTPKGALWTALSG